MMSLKYFNRLRIFVETYQPLSRALNTSNGMIKEYAVYLITPDVSAKPRITVYEKQKFENKQLFEDK